MAGDRLIIVAYDIRNPGRWRRAFRTMNGYGQWIQLSVFECRLTARRRAEMVAKLTDIIKFGDDHVVIVDVGPADSVHLAIESLGRTVPKLERGATVI